MKIWKVREPDLFLQKTLSEALNISTVTAQLLANRGITSPTLARQFLACSLDSCHDPFLFKDMEKAVGRIRKAISKGEKILVYGDYDVDGITAVALLYSSLRYSGGHVEYYIPNRIEEGYGLNLSAINEAKKRKVSLIVTVDCGITSYREIEFANNSKIDVIVTDHHKILNNKLPEAYAIINPLQDGCEYPYKHLAGVGIAYKLAKALLDGGPVTAEDFLDLISLGTVADIVPQVGENRILTRHGLERLSRSSRVGLQALINISGLNGKDISYGHVGFILGPRINAMGRIGSPEVALKLLLTEDETEANELASVLNTENRNRQKIESAILQEALEKVEAEVDFDRHPVIVLASEEWHPGVIGIVASRLIERFHRPTILISIDEKVGRGSGRSIDGFHLFDGLLKCREFLLGFGGHEAACGLTIEKNRIDGFREAINAIAQDILKEKDFVPVITIDADIPLSLLKEKVLYEIEGLSPFGPSNPRPVLSSRNLRVKDTPRLFGKNGFKFFVTDKTVTCEAVAFGREKLDMPKAGQHVELAYTPSLNTWQGLPSIQLELKDIRY